jgi:hypothetical protein
MQTLSLGLQIGGKAFNFKPEDLNLGQVAENSPECVLSISTLAITDPYGKPAALVRSPLLGCPLLKRSRSGIRGFGQLTPCTMSARGESASLPWPTPPGPTTPGKSQPSPCHYLNLLLEGRQRQICPLVGHPAPHHRHFLVSIRTRLLPVPLRRKKITRALRPALQIQRQPQFRPRVLGASCLRCWSALSPCPAGL